MNLVFLGPPGAGKGTQAKRAAERCQLVHFSTGDMLRAAVRSETAVGREARSFMERGLLVPDDLVGRMVAGAVGAVKGGFVLDGYPRNTAQARVLDDILVALGRSLDRGILIEVPDDVLIARLSGRRSCPGCGALYHITNRPPTQAGVCDRCQEALVVRADDRQEVIRERLQVYCGEKAGLVNEYERRGLLSKVAGSATIEEVEEAVCDVLQMCG